jgi:hypothetical protein
MVVKAVALEAWKAFHLCNRVDGSRSTVGSAIFDGAGGSRSTRAAMAGKVSRSH